MAIHIGRREVLCTLASAAVAWPVGARAQQPGKLPLVGMLVPGTQTTHGQWFASLVQRLRELGWIEGRTVAFEYRWAEGRTDRAAEIAADFVAAQGRCHRHLGNRTNLRGKAGHIGIPIVFAGVADAVGSGIVTNLPQPSGNATGLTVVFTDLSGKRLELLREVLPDLRRLAILTNIGNPGAMLEVNAVRALVRSLGLELVTPDVRRPEDIASAFESLKDRVGGLLCYCRSVHNHQPDSHQHLGAARTHADAARLTASSSRREV